MTWIGSYILSLASSAVFGHDMEGRRAQEDDTFPTMYSSERHKPTVDDVLAVKEALHTQSKLPYELVDTIVDMAEYWPHTTTKTRYLTPFTVTGRRQEEQFFILRSYPLGYLPPMNERPQEDDLAFQDAQRYKILRPKAWHGSNLAPEEPTRAVLSKWSSRSQPRVEHPCRKIVFTIKSRDQGWGGEAGSKGTYKGSYSWFEAGLERMTACTVRQTVELFRAGERSFMGGPEDPISLPEDEALDELRWDDLQPIAFPLSATPEPLVCNLHTITPSTVREQYENAPSTFHHDLLPSPTLTIQKNVVATKQIKEHKVTWERTDNVVPDSVDAFELEKQGRGRESANGEFVRNMKLGDVVTVWAKTRFAGWQNHVEEVVLDVYWAV